MKTFSLSRTQCVNKETDKVNESEFCCCYRKTKIEKEMESGHRHGAKMQSSSMSTVVAHCRCGPSKIKMVFIFLVWTIFRILINRICRLNVSIVIWKAVRLLFFVFVLFPISYSRLSLSHYWRSIHFGLSCSVHFHLIRLMCGIHVCVCVCGAQWNTKERKCTHGNAQTKPKITPMKRPHSLRLPGRIFIKINCHRVCVWRKAGVIDIQVWLSYSLALDWRPSKKMSTATAMASKGKKITSQWLFYISRIQLACRE